MRSCSILMSLLETEIVDLDHIYTLNTSLIWDRSIYNERNCYQGEGDICDVYMSYIAIKTHLMLHHFTVFYFYSLYTLYYWVGAKINVCFLFFSLSFYLHNSPLAASVTPCNVEKKYMYLKRETHFIFRNQEASSPLRISKFCWHLQYIKCICTQRFCDWSRD